MCTRLGFVSLVTVLVSAPLPSASLTLPRPEAPEIARLPGPLEAGWQGKQVCELLVDAERNRLLRCSFAPGEGHERHYHPPHLGFTLAGGRMRITDASGSRIVTPSTGDSWSSEGVAWHEVVNVGDSTSVYLIFEAKSAAPGIAQ